MSYNSSDVSVGNDGTAAQYNNLRADLIKILSSDGGIWNWDGWQQAGETWTYDSETSFTISGDKTTKHKKGDKIKLTQPTNGVKYFLVKSVVYSAVTTITVYGSTVYTLDNEAISSPYFSHGSPVGFPDMNSYIFTYLSDNQAIPQNTATKVAFDSELYDTLGEMNTSTHEATIINEGFYLCSLIEVMDDLDNGYNMRTHLRRNTDTLGRTFTISGATAPDAGGTVAGVYYLNAGDVIDATCLHNDPQSNVLIAGSYSTQMTIKRLRDF